MFGYAVQLAAILVKLVGPLWLKFPNSNRYPTKTSTLRGSPSAGNGLDFWELSSTASSSLPSG